MLEMLTARPVQRMGLWEFCDQLPALAHPIASGPATEQRWPALPAADFTSFLAACRRRLSREEFAAIAPVYYDTAEATDTWLITHPEVSAHSQHRFAAVLTRWLRDVVIGPAPA
ncbi:MAG: hypothetical protein ACRDU4_01700, partial [Mycobacterium sp.]